jgi:CubicO group peptidase (beta-lactamase class C family)
MPTNKRSTLSRRDFLRSAFITTGAAIVAACAGAPATQPTPVPEPTKAPKPTKAPEPTPPPEPTATTAAAPSQDEKLAAEVDTFLGKLNKIGMLSGAFLLAHNGQVILSKGYGMADREAKTPNTPTTRFRIASLTKGFTAMAILMLQEDDKLSVGDPVCKYIKDCPAGWQAIKISHLLTHTAGLYDFRDFAIKGDAKPTPSTSAEVIAHVAEKPPEFAPGTKFSYTNGGFMVAGYVVEQVSGKPYEQFLQERILGPLGMKNTGYAYDESGLAVGYKDAAAREDRVDGSLPFAAAGLYSTVEDLYVYTQALDANRPLPQKSMDALFGKNFQCDDAGGFGPDYQLPVYYGYGWAIASYNGHRVIGHDAWIEGYSGDVRRFPDDKLTMILLTNQSDPLAPRLGDQVVEMIFKE